jgi:hypothetical protein
MATTHKKQQQQQQQQAGSHKSARIKSTVSSKSITTGKASWYVRVGKQY